MSKKMTNNVKSVWERKASGWKKLTKKEKKHLKEAKITNLHTMRKQVEYMEKLRGNADYKWCYECEQVARKLGLWQEGVQ